MYPYARMLGWPYNSSMTCPNCLDKVTISLKPTFHRAPESPQIPLSLRDHSTTYSIRYGHCPSPECGRVVIMVSETKNGIFNDRTVVPIAPSIKKFRDVPEHILSDYMEASQVLPISPNASAALARRCLQATIRRSIGDKMRSLRDELAEFRKSASIPPWLRDSLDTVRIVGNDGAHPGLDTHADKIVGVDPDDAGWLLRILGDLFQYCFVAPGEYRRRESGSGEGAAAA